ncbi:MAG: hypothetical protein JWP27_255 [Flaviaesturariibacter sp.]|nr:hypothetical protein [Flaviaesturariibacter sp.]
MEFINDWWGIKENISPLELSARAAVMFIVCLLMLRLAGMRPFGKGSTLDTILTFLVGGILSRGVVGATPFFSCIAGTIVILFLNKALAMVSMKSARFEHLVKGEPMTLYKNGKFESANLRSAELTEADIYEDLRVECQVDSLESIEAVIIEKRGKLSFIKKE